MFKSIVNGFGATIGVALGIATLGALKKWAETDDKKEKASK